MGKKKKPAKSVYNIPEKIYEILKKDNVTFFSSYKMEKEKKVFKCQVFKVSESCQ